MTFAFLRSQSIGREDTRDGLHAGVSALISWKGPLSGLCTWSDTAFQTSYICRALLIEFSLFYLRFVVGAVRSEVCSGSGVV